MNKKLVAIMAAILITGSIAMFMIVVSVNAMTNQTGTVASNSAASAAVSSSKTVSSDQAQQIAQLQAEVTQYQSREQQYQAALASDNQQLTQAATQTQMIQQLLAYLQNQNLIQINSQGRIFVVGH